MFCPKCGAKTTREARYCQRCGAELPATPATPDAGETAPLPAAVADNSPTTELPPLAAAAAPEPARASRPPAPSSRRPLLFGGAVGLLGLLVVGGLVARLAGGGDTARATATPIVVVVTGVPGAPTPALQAEAAPTTAIVATPTLQAA